MSFLKLFAFYFVLVSFSIFAVKVLAEHIDFISFPFKSGFDIALGGFFLTISLTLADWFLLRKWLQKKQ